MPIIFVCGLPFGGGDRVARALADKLGYGLLTREDVVARANECGIPVGKLEVAMIKKPSVQERMARLKDRYLAVATATLCERAAHEDIVYYGRAGHLLLPGVSHVLRVRIVPEPGERLEAAMQRLKLPREKAERFLRETESDIAAWVRFVHGVDMEDPRHYDFILNMENLSSENASAALCGIAQLPDFLPTPASRRAMADRLLQARARIALALDERTADLDLTVRAVEGVVTITYMPRQAREARDIPPVLGDLEGCREIRCTMAGTNILWIEEAFAPNAVALDHMKEMARRWEAAVEMLEYQGSGEDGESAQPAAGSSHSLLHAPGGVGEDTPEAPLSEAEKGFRETQEALILAGRSGGGQRVRGTRERLVSAVNPTIPYSLVVVGELFRDKPKAAAVRMTRELCAFLGRRLKAPVVSTAELDARLRVRTAQVVKVVAAGAVTLAMYLLLFTNQVPVLSLMGGEAHAAHRWAAPALVALAAPLVAALLGSVVGFLLKLAKFE